MDSYEERKSYCASCPDKCKCPKQRLNSRSVRRSTVRKAYRPYPRLSGRNGGDGDGSALDGDGDGDGDGYRDGMFFNEDAPEPR